jgi:hypothetical protein
LTGADLSTVCPGRVGQAATGDALQVLEGFALAPVLSRLSVLLTADRIREVRNQASSRETSAAGRRPPVLTSDADEPF